MESRNTADAVLATAIRPETLMRARQAVANLQQAIKFGRIASALSAADVLSEFLDEIEREMRS